MSNELLQELEWACGAEKSSWKRSGWQEMDALGLTNVRLLRYHDKVYLKYAYPLSYLLNLVNEQQN